MPAMHDKTDPTNPQEGIIMRQEYPIDEIPNADTLKAISELEEGRGMLFTGSTEDFFKILMESDN